MTTANAAIASSDDLRSLLAEAIEWIERPVTDADDAPLFLDFLRRARWAGVEIPDRWAELLA